MQYGQRLLWEITNWQGQCWVAIGLELDLSVRGGVSPGPGLSRLVNTAITPVFGSNYSSGPWVKHIFMLISFSPPSPLNENIYRYGSHNLGMTRQESVTNPPLKFYNESGV